MRYTPLNHHQIITAVKDYIWKQRNFRRQNITAADVAQELGVSRSILLKIFKEEMSLTFLEYINDCRLRHSRKMLMDNHGRFPMDHIQVMSGFGSINTFYTKYKAKYGEMPQETEQRQIENLEIK